jgi:sugar phosphate isomerase/epimerase
VLEEIRASGFQAIEVCSFPQHLDYHLEDEVRRAGEMMRSLGLRPISFHAPFANRIDITSLDDGVRETAVAESSPPAGAAALLGAEKRRAASRPRARRAAPAGRISPAHAHAAVSLNRVAAYCCETGVQLLLENHAAASPLRPDQRHDVSPRRDQRLHRRHLPRHRPRPARGDLGQRHSQALRHLKMVHINDNHGDWDAHLIPGDGSIDWPWLISELQRYQFHGGLIIEMSALENETVADTLTRGRRGRDFLCNLLPSAPNPPITP